MPKNAKNAIFDWSFPPKLEIHRRNLIKPLCSRRKQVLKSKNLFIFKAYLSASWRSFVLKIGWKWEKWHFVKKSEIWISPELEVCRRNRTTPFEIPRKKVLKSNNLFYNQALSHCVLNIFRAKDRLKRRKNAKNAIFDRSFPTRLEVYRRNLIKPLLES